MMGGLIVNQEGFAYQKDLNILNAKLAVLEAKVEKFTSTTRKADIMSGATPIRDSINYMRDVAKRRGFPFCEKHGVMYDDSPGEGCIFCNENDPGISESAAYIREGVALQPTTAKA